MSPSRGNDDPLKLREMLTRAASLASDHEVHSTVVGLAAPEGDLGFPELVDYFESSLRVDDSIFRMTPERAVLLLADVQRDAARDIVARLIHNYRNQFSVVEEPEIRFGYYEVAPDVEEVSVKSVLPSLFAFPTH